MDLPVYEIFLLDDEEKLGIALVDRPAIKKDFMYFNDTEIKMEFNDEKMIVKGPIMIPNYLMHKNDVILGERYVFYSEDTVYQFAEMIMNKKEKFNLQHTLNNAQLNILEIYFATEPNQFNVPKNSLIVSAKVKDLEVWNKIKAGELNGFSIQGLFGQELIEFAESFNKKTNGNMKEIKEKLFSAINAILFDEAPVEEPTKVEEPIVEEFESVDSQEVVSKVEEQVNEAEAAVEATTDEALTIESVKALLEQLKTSISADFTSQLNNVQEQMKAVNSKVEEFSAQPISHSVTEEVANPLPSKNKAAEYLKYR